MYKYKRLDFHTTLTQSGSWLSLRNVGVIYQQQQIEMKVLPMAFVLVLTLILYQINPSGCGFPISIRFNPLAIKSIIAPDKLKSFVKSVQIQSRVDNGLQKLRLLYMSNYSIKAALRSTITVSSTSTTTITTGLYCARIQNLAVTGACSRRRKEIKLNNNKIIANYDDEIQGVQPTNVLNRFNIPTW